MKVTLIYPACIVEMGHWIPLGLAYIAANLRKNGHSVEVIDREVLRRKHKSLSAVDAITRKMLERTRPDVVGLTATTPLIKDAYRAARFTKTILPDSKVVIGGNHVSCLPKETLQECPDIDIVIVGEGEYSMVEIADGKDLKEIDGIAYRSGKNIIENQPRKPIEDLDSLPHPARDLFDTDYYFRSTPMLIRGIELKGTHVFTARGCPFSCRFCAGSKVFGRRVRSHSIDYIMQELRHLVNKYGIEGIYFGEDLFSFNRKRAIEICERIIKERLHKKLVWVAELRADVVNAELLAAMKKAGCVQIEYGFESGSQRMLDLMNKHTTVEQNIKAARLTKKAGLRVLASVIVGYPGEREEDFVQTVEFLKKIKADFIGFNKYAPLPGSETYEMLRNQGKVTDDWDEINMGVTNTGKFNFTEIGNERFMKLFMDAQRNLVEPTNDLTYLKYNLMKRPFRMGVTLASKALENPSLVMKRIIESSKRVLRLDASNT